VGIGPKLSLTPGRVGSPGPVPGQHTEEVLTELGYTPQQIQALRGQGALE
jgi:formyl-CoA transferase